MTSTKDEKREMLRHTLATLAYRGGKTLRGAPEGFGAFRAGASTRTPAEILAHVGDLLDWAHNLARGSNTGQNSTPLPWEEEVSRFFAELEKLDSYLASDSPLGSPAEKLFQGPIADALTHVGQIALLRRMAGAPPARERSLIADIAARPGGPGQPTPPTGVDSAGPRTGLTR